jgi:hypothetical protein
VPTTFFVDASAAAAEPESLAGEPSLQSFLAARPRNGELATLRSLSRGNVTTFTRLEAANPFHFFEQARRCYHCGRHLFTITRHCTCCDGLLVHDDILPTRHLDVRQPPPALLRCDFLGAPANHV